MSFCLVHGVRDTECELCEAKGSEMPVLKTAPAKPRAPKQNAMALSATVGGSHAISSTKLTEDHGKESL